MSSASSTGPGRRQGPRRGGRGRGRGQQGDSVARGARSPRSGGPGNGGGGQVEGPPGRGFGTPFTPRAAYRGASGSTTQGRPGGTIFMQDRPSAVDARIRDGSDKAVVAALGKSGAGADPDSNGLPLRPDFGMQGRDILLRTNYFPVDIQGKIYRYSAVIALPDKKLSRSVKHRVFELAEQTVDWKQAGMPGHVAYDSAEKLVASILLPEPLTIRGKYCDEGEDGPPSEGGAEYALSLTFEEEVDQQTLNECLAGKPVDSQALARVLSALNLVLTAHTSQAMINIGRGDESKKHPDQRLFFDTPDPANIGGGLTVRKGFYVSVRPAHQQLMVNVNTCHAAFYKPQNFVDALAEYRQFVNSGTIGVFGIQVRVMTQHTKRIVMIQGISKKNARQHRMRAGPFGNVTIEKYYELKYDIKLVHPNLELLEGPGGSLYPPELCDILENQTFKGELTDSKHATAMLDVACKPPKENADEIVHRGLDMLGFRDSNPLLESFGMRVGTEMAVVPGRVLDKPGLAYSSDAPASIDERASWNLRNVKFAVGSRLDKWAVLVVQDSGRDDFRDVKDTELQNIVSGFCTMCNTCGMQVRQPEEQAYAAVRLPRRGNPKDNRFRDNAIEEIERSLGALVEQAAPELVLIMLSSDDKAIYNGIKWLCDVKLDLATVCMQSKKVRKVQGRQQYFANVALKVNMKLGGTNHTLDANSGAWLRSASTMIMGMDVTHPANGVSADGTPSIVAVVASTDEHFAQYPAILNMRRSKVEIDRVQGSGDSIIRDMFISRFELYKARNNGELPERVILYRDGVSESQFVQVRQYELTQMKRAFERFSAYRPKLSIVVCGKRHNTRFYPTQQKDAARDGNPLPGTVVDRGVTPAYEFDFFLQAHGGLKGTTRPTHYFVVHDENGFNADDLQRVTNDLSYMFTRATKAVSLVSPAYWADIACERGRCYLHKLLMGGKDGDEAKDKGKKGKQRAEDAVFEKAAGMWGNGVSGPRLRDKMFYL